jgi:glutaconate CoA-transferase subunit A
MQHATCNNMQTKLISLEQAIDTFVPDGASVAMGLALEAAIPFAAGHELIRQRKRDLTLIGPISDMLFDQLIGAGCVKTVIAAWVGNVSVGSGYAFRRAVEQGIPHTIEVRDHSNFTLMLALTAGSLGAPFIPTHTAMGSELSSTNTDLIERINPLNERGEPLLLVRALNPDVAIVHVQRACADGGAHLLGNWGVTKEAALAAKRLIITTEEVVSPDEIYANPNSVLLPPFKVDAVVHVPGGAHPAPVYGVYDRDHTAFTDYAEATRTVEGMRAWLAEWVEGIPNREAYLAKVRASNGYAS